MGRAKISTRNSCFVNRRKGLKKKIRELSVLCGVDAFMIVFDGSTGSSSSIDNKNNRISDDQLTEPVEVWPENREEVLRIIDRFQKSAKPERSKRSSSHFNVFIDRKRKMEEDVSKACWESNADFSDGINELKEEELRELLGSLDCKIQIVSEKMGLLKHQNEVGMTKYSIGASDHQNTLAAPVLAQPINFIPPATDHLHQHQILSHDFLSNHGMPFDVGFAVVPTSNQNLVSCNDPDVALVENVNTWPVLNSQFTYNFGRKPLDCIQYGNSVPLSSIQQVQPLSSCPPYALQGAWDHLISLNHDFQNLAQGLYF